MLIASLNIKRQRERERGILHTHTHTGKEKWDSRTEERK
jgi:hypothetical protein